MPGRKFNADDNEDQTIGTKDDPAGGEEGACRGIIDGLKRVLELRKLAGNEAARAAPYCHPRLGVIEDTPLTDEVPLAERLLAYQRRDEIEASASKVVIEDTPLGRTVVVKSRMIAMTDDATSAAEW